MNGCLLGGQKITVTPPTHKQQKMTLVYFKDDRTSKYAAHLLSIFESKVNKNKLFFALKIKSYGLTGGRLFAYDHLPPVTPKQ